MPSLVKICSLYRPFGTEVKYCHSSMKAQITSLKFTRLVGKVSICVNGRSSVTPPMKVLTPKKGLRQNSLNKLKLAVHIGEHSSVVSVDNLGEAISPLDDKSQYLSKIKHHRTKCSRLQKLVLETQIARKQRDDI